MSLEEPNVQGTEVSGPYDNDNYSIISASTISGSRPGLEYLCIYNPDLGSEENLADQILFYYGPGSQDDQLRSIGLAQGVVEFSREFSSDGPLSSLEMTNSRIIIKQVEPPNWWIMVCYRFGSGEDLKDGRAVAMADMLAAQVTYGYRRWRLHHGTLSGLLDSSRETLKQSLSSWWMAWAKSWQPAPTTLTEMLQVDHLRTARGILTSATSEAAQAIVDKGPSLLYMVVTRHNDVDSDPILMTHITGSSASKTTVDNEGCVWTGGSASIDHKSLCDLVNWIRECHDCDDDAAFLEQSGFVSHLHRHKRKQRAGNKEVTPSSSLRNMAALLPSMSSVTSVATESVNQLMGLVSLKPMWPDPRSPEAVSPVHGPTDDLGDSRFLIGLRGDLEEGSSRRITSKQVYLDFVDADKQKCCRVVVYRRRPFVFTLIYTEDSSYLYEVDHYLTLHRRLASLSEPFSTDLAAREQRPNSRFYYLVLDPAKTEMQTSLPSIPELPPPSQFELLESSVAERLLMDRLELAHVHLAITQLVLESRRHEQEKFIRTAKNWWVYWSKLADNRQIVFARKGAKTGKPSPSESSGLLGALGKDAKQWLDDYKYYGKV
jgi:hypothetical protein